MSILRLRLWWTKRRKRSTNVANSFLFPEIIQNIYKFNLRNSYKNKLLKAHLNFCVSQNKQSNMIIVIFTNIFTHLCIFVHLDLKSGKYKILANINDHKKFGWLLYDRVDPTKIQTQKT